MKISISGCSWMQLKIIAEKCGFVVREGSNHSIVEDKSKKLITTIPRHNPVDKWTVKGVIRDFKKAGCQRKEIEHIK